MFNPDANHDLWKSGVDIIWSNPLCVQLVENTTGEIIPYTGSAYVTSLSRNKTEFGGVDNWKGMLCNQDMSGTNFYRFLVYQPFTLIKYCADISKNYELHLWSMVRGSYYMRNFIWKDKDFAGDQRNIRFVVPYMGNTYTLDSPWFDVWSANYTPNRIAFFEPPPTSVVANTPFTIKLKIINANNGTVDRGMYSNYMEVMATASNIYKTFSRGQGDATYRLVHTEQQIAGNDAVVLPYDDTAIFKTFSNGRVDVTMKLEDVMENCWINFTLKLTTHSYRRYPENEYMMGKPWQYYVSHYWYDVKQSFFSVFNTTHVKYKLYPEGGFPIDHFRAVLLSQINVTAQVATSLRIVPGTESPYGNQNSNIMIQKPVQVEILDSNGRRVTSGPHSSLLVNVKATNGAQLSSDANFRLARGVGTFQGSVAEPVASTALRFEVTANGNLLSSSPTSAFNVKNVWNLVGNLNSDFETKLVKAAIETGERFWWLGRRVINVQSVNSSDALNEYFLSSQTNMDKYVVGMLAPYREDLHDNFVDIAQTFKSPIVSVNTKTVFSNKGRYPSLKRITFTDLYKYYGIANALKTRLWYKIAVIGMPSMKLSSDFIKAFDHFGIWFEQVYFPDNVTNAAAMDSFFQKLEMTKTSTFFSFVSGTPLSYLLTESIKRKLTPADGYNWVGDDAMMTSFPYNNDGACSSLPTGTSCVKGFRGLMIFQSYYPMYGLNGYSFGTLSLSWTRLFRNQITAFFPTNEIELMNAWLLHDTTAHYMMVFKEILFEKLTARPETVSNLLKTITPRYHLISDNRNIPFDDNNERMNFTGAIYQIDGTSNALGKSNVLKLKRLIYLGDNVTADSIGKNNILKEVSFNGEPFVHSNISDAYKNTVSMLTIDGTWLSDLSMAGGKPYKEINVTEKWAPSYYCTGGCGGQQLNPSNNHFWSFGHCEGQDICRCIMDPITGKPGYTGKNCQHPVCPGCLYGDCNVPSNCSCWSGYVNSPNASDCGIPTCLKYGCNLNFGNCTSGDFCKCLPGHFGSDCSGTCNCGSNGVCSDGNTGTGKCTCDSGYIGATCGMHVAVIVVPTLIGCVIIVVLLFLIGRKKYQQMQMLASLMSTDWKADWDNIKLRQSKQKSSMKSLISMISMMSAKSGKQEEKVVCQNQGLWNGKDVVVKLIRKDHVELTEDIRWEIKQMRDLKHPNLCLFVGACIDSPNVCILNEVCGKGSLEDILSNDSIELGWDFRYSMMKDIVRGMQYLAKSDIGSHGRLKSSNCLVDNRWTVKLADYGMKTFKGNQFGVRVFTPNSGIGVQIPQLDEMDQCDYYNLLWTAPEIVATGVSHPDHVQYGTIVGDVYSFGIILCEMCTRNHPYHELDFLSPDKIVQMIGRLIPYDSNVELVKCQDTDRFEIEVLRPQVNEDELPTDPEQGAGLMNLIEGCWNQDVHCRPTFDKCMKSLNSISPHRGELMDNLILLMEQYTNHLEVIISERTVDVKAEKEKTDVLLSKMLPPLIAEELKTGSNPKPEYFNCVTIYFSDVVGFGKICATATPYEVVDLLNELYSVMDDVIDSFDCYKVETIGDCYMVVSGLPVRNGDNHAGEIASMALHLLSSFYGLGYKHLPGSQVQLRIGMHSGPCVAGVVGLKMPRYCLFGDTVNTASRMESGGFALKVHLSEDTYVILERLGGYQFECRGERQVKGRGTMTTYWLTGKDGSDYRLPTEDMALSASQHDFK